ncbi:Putative protein C11orf85 like protein [Chelonia mydas]|uniref:Uncharacterized protein n=1 Tax=Chelonia mydas TaxID=8469 RepID=M7BXH8_CHEMY|nr:Putative protein C11orf85 like protein [Chelonia mydas]
MFLKPFTYPVPETRFLHAGRSVYKLKIRYGNFLSSNDINNNETTTKELEAVLIPLKDRSIYKAIIIVHGIRSQVSPTDNRCGQYAARSTTTAVVMRRHSWLSSSSFPREVQTTIEDLPFDGDKLFASTTNDILHSMKDSRATLWSLGIQTSMTRKRQYRYQYYQCPRYPTYTQHFQRSHDQQQQQCQRPRY